MDRAIIAGDVVALNSNDKRMTVEEINEDDVFCVWFEGRKCMRGSFSSALLKVIS